jgi:uncharacterized protein (TIGR03067 family)
MQSDNPGRIAMKHATADLVFFLFLSATACPAAEQGGKVVIHGCDGTAWESSTETDVEGRKQLLGTWKGREANSADTWTAVFRDDDSFEITGQNAQEYKGSYTCDGKREPKHLDLYLKQCHASEFVARSWAAIYAIKGDTLTYAAGEPGVVSRPESFTPGTGARIFTFKKQD